MTPFLAAFALAAAFAAQVRPTTVSLDARGQDVREVLATLFVQARRPYALDASIKGSLYIKVDGMAYDKALALVLGQSKLSAREQDGVTIVSAAPAPAPKILPARRPVAAPSGEEVLARKVTTRLTKAPLATVFASLGKQAGTAIVVDPSVPAYRIDAHFSNLSLRDALHRVCEAAGLEIQSTDGRIRIYRKAA